MERHLRGIGIGLLSFLLFFGLLLIGPAPAFSGDELVVQTWGGTLDEAQRKYMDAFNKEFEMKVVSVEAGADAGGKLAAMQRSRNIEWDVISGNYENYVKMWYDKGLLQDVDYNLIKDTDGMLPDSMQPWGVASHLEGICLVYNTNAFPPGKEPKGWKDFFDVENFPGPRSMHNWGGPADNLAIALMADGAGPNEVFPIDYKRAFAMMDKVKPHVKVWYTSGNQLVQALKDEEVVMAVATDGRARSAIAMGAPIKIVWDQGFYFYAWWGVVKNSENADWANKFINLACRPDLQAEFIQIIGYSTPNVKAIEYLPKELQPLQLTHPDNVKKVFNMMEVKNARSWMMPNMEKIDEIWNTWIAQ